MTKTNVFRGLDLVGFGLTDPKSIPSHDPVRIEELSDRTSEPSRPDCNAPDRRTADMTTLGSVQPGPPRPAPPGYNANMGALSVPSAVSHAKPTAPARTVPQAIAQTPILVHRLGQWWSKTISEPVAANVVIKNVRAISDSPGATPLWAAWRGGLKDLWHFLDAFPAGAPNHPEPGSIGTPAPEGWGGSNVRSGPEMDR